MLIMSVLTVCFSSLSSLHKKEERTAAAAKNFPVAIATRLQKSCNQVERLQWGCATRLNKQGGGVSL